MTLAGLRPGEKLYEEKLMAEEGLKKTRNELIHIGCPIPFEVETFLKELETLMDMAYINADHIREKVAEIVTTYHPAGEHGSEKKGEVYERLLGEESEAQQKLACCGCAACMQICSKHAIKMENDKTGLSDPIYEFE